MTTGSDDCEISWHCRAQCGHVVRAEVLHLVDEDRHADATIRRESADVAEQLDEVDLDVARVGPAGHCGHVDPDTPPVAQPASATRCTPPVHPSNSPARPRVPRPRTRSPDRTRAAQRP
jgi:hypothetical protein